MLSYSPLQDVYADATGLPTQQPNADDKPERRRRKRGERSGGDQPEESEIVPTYAGGMLAPQRSAPPPAPKTWRPYSEWDNVLPYAVTLAVVALLSMLYEIKNTLVDIRGLLTQGLRPRGAGLMM